MAQETTHLVSNNETKWRIGLNEGNLVRQIKSKYDFIGKQTTLTPEFMLILL